jgi:hypothetical protein
MKLWPLSLTMAFGFAAPAVAEAVAVSVSPDSVRDSSRDAPAKAIDGSIADRSRWVSRGTRGLTDGSDPHWLILEFDRPLSFDEVRLFTGYGHDPESALYSYSIQIAGDGNWVDVCRASGNVLLNPRHTFRAVTAARMRLYVRQGAVGDSFARVKEIELYHQGKLIMPERVENQSGYFGAPRIAGSEDAFCRRAYRIMLRGAAFCRDLYREWEVEPECGYIGWGGHGEKEIGADIGMAHLYAILITFGRYDEAVTGVSRSEALRRVKGVIRYCGFTHVSGPHPCIDGQHWGGGWHDASWSTVFAHAAWLVWHDLDEQTRELAARVIAAEADRFVGLDPPSGKIDDTKAEENAWNTRALAIAAVMFPTHPHAGQWHQTCIRWMMNTLTVAADRDDDTLVDGKPVREWVMTENVHSDFTLENHGIVYPVYMWAGMNGLCQSAAYYVFAGREPPQAACHHLRDVYGVYKRLQTWEGLPAYINGSDKFLHLQVVDIFLHSFLAQVLGDPEAAHLEAVELDILERMQGRFTDGRLYPVEEVGEWSRVHNLGWLLGGSYLLHYVRPSGVRPVSADEFERRIGGVTYFPDGKFLLHRTRAKLVSFAWSKPYRVMGLAIPREGSWLVTPHVRGFVGVVLEEGADRETPMKLTRLDRESAEDSFTVSATALRCGAKVEHQWTFESPANAEVVMREKLIAAQPLRLAVAETGTVGIGRELGSAQVALRSAQGMRAVGGPRGAAEETLEFPGGWVEVGGRFAYHWAGTGTICYRRHAQPRTVHGAPGGYGHIEDELYVRHLGGPRQFAAGETIAEGELRILMLP